MLATMPIWHHARHRPGGCVQTAYQAVAPPGDQAGKQAAGTAEGDRPTRVVPAFDGDVEQGDRRHLRQGTQRLADSDILIEKAGPGARF